MMFKVPASVPEIFGINAEAAQDGQDNRNGDLGSRTMILDGILRVLGGAF